MKETDLEKQITGAFEEKINKLDADIEHNVEIIKALQTENSESQAEKTRLSKECLELLEKVNSNQISGSPSFSLREDDGICLSADKVKKANEWIQYHELTHHTADYLRLKDAKYSGAIGISRYELRKGWTSIGSYVDLVCTDCIKNQQTDANFEIEEL